MSICMVKGTLLQTLYLVHRTGDKQNSGIRLDCFSLLFFLFIIMHVVKIFKNYISEKVLIGFQNISFLLRNK